MSRHEEGGYIVLNADGSFGVERWPRGEQSGIMPPPLGRDNRYKGREVVAAFHTHPNPAIDETGIGGKRAQANMTDAGTRETSCQDTLLGIRSSMKSMQMDESR